MSFDLAELPEITLPNHHSLPVHNPQLLYLPTSTTSTMSEVLSPPSPSTEQYTTLPNISSPSESQSYTLNSNQCNAIISPIQGQSHCLSPSNSKSQSQRTRTNLTEVICNTPNTINSIIARQRFTFKSRQSTRHKHASAVRKSITESLNGTELPLSETPLTPTPKQDIHFTFGSDDIKENNPVNVTQTLHVLIENICETYSESPKESDSSDQPRLIENLSEDAQSEVNLLRRNGLCKLTKITDTLQGSVFSAKSNHALVVVKRTSKYLHSKGITIQNGKEFAVNENVIKEYSVLKQFSAQRNCPCQITKALDFLESENNYYLVMENAGDDFFDFIVRAHALMNEGKMRVKEWRKFVKYMFYQMVVVVHWLHNFMHCCHLDISLENITVLNGSFIVGSDGYHTVNPSIKIKFVDFGLAEFFDPVQRYECVKYCGKTAYKAPEIYRAKRIFNAKKADVWSLGVVLFCMAVGSPPYVKPSNSDDAYKYFIKTGEIEKLLFQWNRHFCVTVKMLDLIKKMLCVDISRRYVMDNVVRHGWLAVYQKQFNKTYNFQFKNNFNRMLNQGISVYKLP